MMIRYTISGVYQVKIKTHKSSLDLIKTMAYLKAVFERATRQPPDDPDSPSDILSHLRRLSELPVPIPHTIYLNQRTRYY